MRKAKDKYYMSIYNSNIKHHFNPNANYVIFAIYNRNNSNKLEYIEYEMCFNGVSEFGFVTNMVYAKPVVKREKRFFNRLKRAEQIKEYIKAGAKLKCFAMTEEMMEQNKWESVYSSYYPQDRETTDWWDVISDDVRNLLIADYLRETIKSN